MPVLSICVLFRKSFPVPISSSAYKFSTFSSIRFNVIYFVCIFFSSPRSCLLSQLQLCAFSLSKRKTKQKSNNKTEKNKNVTPTQRKKCTKNKRKMASPFVGQFLGREACPGVWLVYPVKLRWRKLMFPFPASINYKQLFA